MCNMLAEIGRCTESGRSEPELWLAGPCCSPEQLLPCLPPEPLALQEEQSPDVAEAEHHEEVSPEQWALQEEQQPPQKADPPGPPLQEEQAAEAQAEPPVAPEHRAPNEEGEPAFRATGVSPATQHP